MKRILVMMLTVAMAANLVACGCGTTNNSDAQVEQEAVVEEDPTMNQPAAAPEDTPAEMPTPSVDAEGTVEDDMAVSGDTVGAMLAEEFHALKAEKPEITAQEMADAIITNPIIAFGGATMEVQPGLLTGFDNAEITGFSNGVMFAPMIGSIPFVGYVFTLEDGVDAAAFMQTLTDSANPRWNICVEADETVVENADNMVFFVMCPAQFEE